MVSYDPIIPPGGEGNITLKIDTGNLSGAITKTARVFTNDPKNPQFLLTVKAFIKVPFIISPKQVNMRGYDGQNITSSVTITAMEKTALNIEPAHFDLSERISYRIQIIEPGKNYQIDFKSLPGPVGTFRGLLKLKTNYPENPEINIPIRLQIRMKAVIQDK